MKYQKQYLCFIKVILFLPTYKDIETIHNNTSIITSYLKAIDSTKDCIYWHDKIKFIVQGKKE